MVAPFPVKVTTLDALTLTALRVQVEQAPSATTAGAWARLLVVTGLISVSH